MKTSFELNDNTYYTLKIYCFENNLKLGEFCTQAIVAHMLKLGIPAKIRPKSSLPETEGNEYV